MKGDTYKKLKKYEGAMQCAATCGYIRLSMTQVSEFADLYEQTFWKALTRQQRTCGHCLQKAAVALWNEYQRYKNSPWGKKIDNADQE